MRQARIVAIVLTMVMAATLMFVSLSFASTAAEATWDDGDDTDPPDPDQAAEQERSRAAEEAGVPAGVLPRVETGGIGDGPLFVGVDDTTVPAYRIDVQTSSFTEVFTGVQVWGAAYDALHQRVLFNSGSQLWVWPVGGVPSLMGTITSTGSAMSVVGLAHYNGTLFASRNLSPEDIYAIDTTTLVASVAIDLIPADAELDLGGIAVDQQTGRFFATNDDADLRGLVEIGADGSVTVIAPYPAAETDIDGLAVGGGNAYLVTDQPGFIYVYNFETMTYTVPLNNPWTTAEIFAAGAWISPTGKLTYCSQPALPIPQNNPVGITDTLVISDYGTISDLDIRLDIPHTWVGDLIVELEHVDSGTTATLVDRPGVPASAFGCSGNDIAAYIDDEGLNGDVESACAPSVPTISGNFVGGDPANSSLLATFDGLELSGAWRLTVSDNAPADSGALDAWCVAATVEPPQIVVDQQTVTSTQAAEREIVRQVTISNVGGSVLHWSAHELLPALPARALPAPSAITAPVAGRQPASSSPVREPAPVVTGPEQCPLYENYPGAEPPGYALHCLGRDPAAVPNPPSSLEAIGMGFAHDIGFVSDNVVDFVVGDFAAQTLRSYNHESIYAYDYDSGGQTLYALHDGNQELGTFDAASGTFTAIGASMPVTGHTWSGLAIHPIDDTFYASSTDGTASTLYTLDPATGSATPVANITDLDLVIAIAMNSHGHLYAHDAATDGIYLVDPVTGASSLLGYTGRDAVFAQGMDFDNRDGALYIFLYEGGGVHTFGTMDLVTGDFTALSGTVQGEFEGAMRSTVPCADDTPWLSVTPAGGSVPNATAATFTATLDSTGLALGTYTSTLCLDSNDPYQPRILIPVTLTVDALNLHLPVLAKP